MDQGRRTTVLFADVSGSTKLYESEGDQAALAAIERCVAHMRQAVEAWGGRVVKTIGDEVMAVFPTSDAAAQAASIMQTTINALPPVGKTRMGLRIGFHSGPVIQQDSDVFGDTVNMAARLVGQAARDQIIMSRETADELGPIFRSFKRPLYAIHVKGKVEEVELCELIWRQSDDMTMSVGSPSPKPEPLVLRLKYHDREVVRRRDGDSISIGRDTGCDLPITTNRASRRHCVIERQNDRFVLADQSTNGTYVTPDGGTETLLRREDIPLGRHGWIAFGQPRAEADPAEIVEYFCDSQ